jgi:predicted alpha-1,6-mannanase (GH76 family)
MTMLKDPLVTKSFLVLALAGVGIIGGGISAHAQGPDKTLAMDCWNNHFYNSTNGFWDSTAGGTNNGFWQNAEMIELLEDAAAMNSKYNGCVSAEIYAFENKYGTNWTGNAYNDDMTWASLAFLRGGQYSIAKSNFDAMWSRAYDATLVPGLWWSTAKSSKNACVNCPATICAALLGEISNANTLWNGYDTNSKTCDLSKYRVADHINSDGTVDWSEFTYNQGTEIGAAMATFHPTAASMALNESVSAFGTPMRSEGSGDNDAAGFRGIFSRWASQYTGSANYLTTNANDAWNSRNSSGLTAGAWTTRSTDGTVYAWDCSAATATVQDYPSGTNVNLSSYYNLAGIWNDGVAYNTGGIDSVGYSLSGTLLGSTQNWIGTTFTIGPSGSSASGTNDVVSCTGQTVSLPNGSYNNIVMLATTVNGNQASETFTVHYTDGTTSSFTQGMSDWYTPQNYAGEINVLAMPYRNASNGTKNNATFYVYGYNFGINGGKTLQSITLPNQSNCKIIAMTLH